MIKILVIRFSSIGDIVLTSPVIRCLKQQLPEAEVHLLTKRQFLPVVEANPYLDRIWLYDKNFRELIPQLKSQGFTFVADLHKNYRSRFVVHQLRAPSGTFPKLNIRKWLLVHLKIDLLPRVHIVDRYFRAVEKLGVHNDGKGLDHFVPAGEELSHDALPGTHHQGYVAVVIGGKHNTKIFPAGRVAELCRQIGIPVVLLGGKEDRQRGEEIAATSGSHVFNACGTLSLHQSALAVKGALVVVSNDTGLMHIAAAYGKPVVSVWGNTVPGFGMYPYLPGYPAGHAHVAEVANLSCRPCSKLGHAACPKGHFRCMNEIAVEPIAGFVNRHANGALRQPE